MELNNNQMVENNNIKKKVYTKRIKLIKDDENNRILKCCKVCKEYKILEEFVINQTTDDKKIIRKNICLLCKQIESKVYYHNNKEKISKYLKDKVIANHKKYEYTFKFNELEDLEKQFDILKQNFIKDNLMFKKTERKKYERKIKPNNENNNNDINNNENIIIIH